MRHALDDRVDELSELLAEENDRWISQNQTKVVLFKNGRGSSSETAHFSYHSSVSVSEMFLIWNPSEHSQITDLSLHLWLKLFRQFSLLVLVAKLD